MDRIVQLRGVVVKHVQRKVDGCKNETASKRLIRMYCLCKLDKNNPTLWGRTRISFFVFQRFKMHRGRSLTVKTPVVSMIVRSEKWNAHYLTDTGTITFTEQLIAVVKEMNQLYTDEWLGYKQLQT